MENSIPIKRKTIEIKSRFRSIEVDVYLRDYEVYLSTDTNKRNGFQVQLSKAATLKDLKRLACEHFNIPDDEDSRLKKIWYTTEKVFADMDEQLGEALDSFTSDTILLEKKEDGEWPKKEE